jgi:hypothetical protein
VEIDSVVQNRSSRTTRVRLIAAAVIFLFAGYWLRFYAPISPTLRDASGGISYVLVFALSFGALLSKSSARNISAGVFLATCSLEFLQLWHPGWLEACRRTLPGRLFLGTTFEWSDFPPYLIGAIFGWFLLHNLRTNQGVVPRAVNR